MKLLILTPGILPDTHSGIGKIAFYIARELRRAGHQIVVLTRQYRPEHPLREQIDGMDYHRIPYPDRWGPLNKAWPVITPALSRRWQRRLRATHPDVDVVWVLNPWWTLACDPRTLWPCATIVSQFYCNPADEIIANNGPTLTARLFGRIYNAVTARGMRRADRVSVLSEFARQDALALLRDTARDHTVIVPGGVDMTCFHAATPQEKTALRQTLQLPTDRPVFITARGLKGRTGVDKLVDAASQLHRQTIPFYLVIVGKGPLKAAIQARMVSGNLADCVRLLSDLSETELADYYRASDAFVLPTQAGEAFGLATVEAIATGLVAFGTNNGGTPEILSRYRTDWIIPGADPTHIAQKMADYCHDPSRFQMPLADTTQITQTHYAWQAVARTFLAACQ